MKTGGWIAVLATVGLAALAAARLGDDPAATAGAAPEQLLHTVTRGDLVVTLTESGSLAAKEATKVTTDTDSSAKLTFLIEEGKQVEQGELLARLDTSQLEDRIEQLEGDILQSETNLATARTELEIQRGDNVANIAKARIELDKVRLEIERYVDGDAPNDRRKLDVAIKQAETDFSRARKKYEDSQELFEQDYINRSQLEQDQIAFERAEVQLESARLDLELFERYTLPMTKTEKQAAVADREREVENAELRAGSTLRQKEVAVEKSDKQLQQQRKNLEELRAEVAKMTVTAPGPGIVLYGDPNESWTRDEIRLGGEIWGSMVLFTLPDLRVMQVKIKVHEADVTKVQVGQAVKVSMDTYPGVILDGSVTKIGSVTSSSDRWSRDSDVKKFDVDITLQGGEELRLKPGVSARAEIFVDTRPNVLSVPLQCVFQEEGRQLCWVAGADGRPQRREVTIGPANENYVEILTGLTEGERVLLYNPRLPSDAGGGADPGADEPGAGEDAGEGEGGGTGPATATASASV